MSEARRIGETEDGYSLVIVDFGDGWRVIEGACGIQWVVQKRLHSDRNPWRGKYFCRTREALVRYAGHGAHPALLKLPDWFSEVGQTAPEAARSDFDSGGLSGHPEALKTAPGVPGGRNVGLKKWVSASDDRAAFDRLWSGDGVLSDWRPAAPEHWGEVPDIPAFLRRVG